MRIHYADCAGGVFLLAWAVAPAFCDAALPINDCKVMCHEENPETLTAQELAKMAKEQGLDAIHNTVYEMARDEARHGKALKALLERYFK